VTAEDLCEEIRIELEYIEATVKELVSLRNDLGENEPTVREKTAAAAFLAQFYNGIENILKRISHYHKIPLSTGRSWHLDLFKRFCSPADETLPELFDQDLALAFSYFRKFRHVVHHGYALQLDWSRMQEGVNQVEDVLL